MDALTALVQQPFTPERFFEDIVHAIHKRHGFQEFDLIAEERLWVRLIVPDPQGGGPEQVWSVGVFTGPLEVREGTHPVPYLLTFVIPRDIWVLMSTRAIHLVERLEEYVEGPGLFVSAEHVPMVRAIRGRIDLRVDGYPTPQGPRDVLTEVWITDQAQRPERGFTVRASAALFERLASGHIDIGRALAHGEVHLEGDIALAMKVGAAIGRLR